MENAALLISFLIVFGGVGFVVAKTLKHFDKTHHTTSS